MGTDDCGEPSRNNNNNDGERPPFKKARYAWQVKGRSHLKDTAKPQCDSKLNGSSVPSSPSSKLTPDQSNCKKSCISGCLHIHNHYINRILTHSENFMSFSMTTANQQIELFNNDGIPITFVKPDPKNYDYYLKKWQARQVAKSFVDNTINGALENWMVTPFDEASDFVENCDNGGMVEDEGILMAIQSHGLQSGSRESQPNPDKEHRSTARLATESCECPYCIHKLSHTSDVQLQNHSRLPFHRREDLDYSDVKLAPDLLSVVEPGESSTDHAMITDTTENTTTVETNASSTLIIGSDFGAQSSSLEHFDFLDAAVAVAIQKKGLTSNNVDYG